MPVIKLDYTNTKIQDAYVNSGNPTANFNGSSFIAGKNGTEIMRGLLQFDLGLIPNDAIINSAILTIMTANTFATTLNIHAVLEQWTEATVNWNSQPTFDATIEGVIVTTSTNGQKVDADITSIIQKNVRGLQNNGVLLENDTGQYDNFHSANSATLANRPTLTIDYTIPTDDKKQVEFVGVNIPTIAHPARANVVIPYPLGIKQDDLVMAFVNYTGYTITAPPPVGWEMRQNSPYLITGVDGVSNANYMLLIKRYKDGDTEPVLNFNPTATYVTVATLAFRNVKELLDIGLFKYTNTSPTQIAPEPINGLPLNGFLLSSYMTTANVSANATSITPPLNFTEIVDVSVNRSVHIVGTYNYSKVNYTQAEMACVRTSSGTTHVGDKTLFLVPITNEAPHIDGIDEYLGYLDTPLNKAYNVTDTEGDSVTITEKLNGTTIRTLNEVGTHTLDLTAQWDELPIGSVQTVTIEAVDSYDPTRSHIRTWTFKKLLHANDSLIRAIQGAQELSAIYDEIKQKLVDKVGGSVLDTFETLLNSIPLPNLKATITSSSSTENIEELSNTGTRPNYSVTVTGLPRKPTKVLVKPLGATTSASSYTTLYLPNVYPYANVPDQVFLNMLGRSYESGAFFGLKANSGDFYVNDNSIKLPVGHASKDYEVNIYFD